MNIIGLTNAMTDIVIRVSERDLIEFGMKKAALNEYTADHFEGSMLLRKRKLVCGGSAGNVIFNLNSLGLKTGLFGFVGSDDIGENYVNYVTGLGIESFIEVIDGMSPVCYCLITPDNERTFYARMGGVRRQGFLPRGMADVFHTTGYELMNDPDMVLRATKYFKKSGSKISFDLACPSGIIKFRDEIEQVISLTDILFSTQEEALALSGAKNHLEFQKFMSGSKKVCYKMGSQGSYVIEGNKIFNIPCTKTRLVNTCGAGDAYAAGFIYGDICGWSVMRSALYGSEIASRVCAREESHL